MSTPTGIDFETLPPCFVCGKSLKRRGTVFGTLALFNGRIAIVACIRCLNKKSAAMVRECERRLREILDKEPAFVFGETKQKEGKSGPSNTT